MAVKNFFDDSFPVATLVIVKRKKTKAAANILKECGVTVSYIVRGKGTAPSRFKAYFGIGGKEKNILLAMTDYKKACDINARLKGRKAERKLENGIYLTVPLKYLSIYNDRENEYRLNGLEGEIMENISSKELIVAIVNTGFTENAMEAARGAGALGGTMVTAKGVGIKKTEKFFGLSLAPDKEIVLIVASTDIAKNIIGEINDKCNYASGASAFVISLPVANFTALAPLS